MNLSEYITQAIDGAFWREREGSPRSYIGASVVGNDCLAYLNFSLRGAPGEPVDPALKRIFRDGHRIEDQVVSDLRKAGLNLSEKDHRTGKQYRREFLGGHVLCHADGLIELPGDEPPAERTAILEIKSMNKDKFADFEKNGVKSSHRHYYRQVQMLMAMFEMPKAVLVAYCKNSSRYHAELVQWDQEEWDWLHTRMGMVLDGIAPRISAQPEDWRCRGCFKKGVCWGVREWEKSCKSCDNSRPNGDGGWTCKLTGQSAIEVCDQYKLLKIQEKL